MKQWIKSIVSGAVAMILMGTTVFAASGDIVLLDVSMSEPVIDTTIAGLESTWTDTVGGFETNAGTAFFKNVVKEGSLFWDFENDSEIGVLTETTPNIDAASYECSYEVGQWVNGTIHNERKAVSKPELVSVSEVDIGGSTPTPGEKCMKAGPGSFSSQQFARYAVRVKIPKNDIRVGENYKLNFSFAIDNPGGDRALWIDFRPYDTKDSVLFSGNTNNSEVWHSKHTDGKVEHNYAQKLAENGKWNEYSVDITPEEADFSDDGYTTLWFVYQPSNPWYKNGAGWGWAFLAVKETIYLDNISLIPAGEEETAEFSFDCSVEGESGQSVTAQAVFDGSRTIFTASGVCGADGKANLYQDFALTSQDAIVTGNNRLTTSASSDARIKIKIYSDEGAIRLGEVSLTKKTSSAAVRPLAVTYEVYSKGGGTVTVKEDETEMTLDSFEVTQGRKRYTKILRNGDFSGECFKLFNALGENIGGKPFRLSKFFRNGAEIDYTSKEIMQMMGAGRYLMEFDVEEDVTDTVLTLNYCGIDFSVKLNGAGTYAAELEIPKENLSKAAAPQVKTEGVSLKNITVKKTLDK